MPLSKSYKVKHAEDVIKATFGDTVSVDAKKKDLVKFGSNPSVGTAVTRYTIWGTGIDQANETYVAANINSISHISSSSTSDTQEVVVEGHTETGGVKTFVTQTLTLNGQNKVALTTPLNRANRIYNNGSTNLIGNVYVYEDTAITSGKPTDTTKIHVSIPTGRNQSTKCATTISNNDYWIITSFTAEVLSNNTRADVALQVRLNGKVFRDAAIISASNNGSGVYGIGDDPFIIVPKNSDVRLVEVASTSGIVAGTISGYLASVL